MPTDGKGVDVGALEALLEAGSIRWDGWATSGGTRNDSPLFPIAVRAT